MPLDADRHEALRVAAFDKPHQNPLPHRPHDRRTDKQPEANK